MKQELLPTIEPSENDLVEMALAMPLEKKVDKAIKLLRLYRPTYIAYSGGKDSGCIKRLCEMAGVDAVPHYNVTTMDAPELVRFVREQKDVKWNRQPKSMMARLVERSNGAPTRMSPWCCEEYKEAGGRGHVAVVGVRVEESPRRRGLWKTVIPKNRGDHVLCPICYWTTEDVWSFHEMEKIPYCCLYDEGFYRLGCVGCPKAGCKNQKAEFERWPGFERSWKRGIFGHWAKYHKTQKKDGGFYYCAKYKTPEAYFNWWLNDTDQQEEDPCQGMNLFQ